MSFSAEQKEYIISEIVKNKGSNNEVSKQELVDVATIKKLNFKKNISKEKLVKLIIEQLGEGVILNQFGKRFVVPAWHLKKIYNLTYKQITDLEQLKIFKAVGSYKDYECYSLESLRYAPEEPLKIWRKKFSDNINRVRVEVKDKEELKSFLKRLDDKFEVTDISKLYEHRNEYNDKKQGYYAYFNLRSLDTDEAIEASHTKNAENIQLKSTIAILEKSLEEAIKENDDSKKEARKTEEFQKLINENFELKCKVHDLKLEADTSEARYITFEQLYNKQKEVIKNLENEIIELKAQLMGEKAWNERKNPRGAGRKARFSEQEKETMKMYKLQGMTIKEIADLYKCAVGTVHKLINEK